MGQDAAGVPTRIEPERSKEAQTDGEQHKDPKRVRGLATA